MNVKLTAKDISTVSRLVAEKAMEMHKKGAMWMRGNEELSCVDMGNLANKVLKPTGQKFDWDAVWNPKKKIKKSAK